ncbi:MAG: TonB-dependent receptor [Desulfobacteraceae bacterium]|jgi:vitamin B12 transporter|nr:TonB-dependent receptor [Desulfobacteraceae bacterium]
MKYCKSILMLNVAWMVLVLFSNTVFAVENTKDSISSESDKTYPLEEIVVSATRNQTPKQDVAANITVVDRQTIEKMPAATAAEVLQYVPGVSVEFNGGPGSMAMVRIQGSEVRQVSVYMDGVPLNQLANPLTDLSSVPVDIIERIEVYKGAASSAWGSSLGGVINIITREPDAEKPFTANIRTSYGKADTSKSRGNISGTKDQFGYFLSLTYDQSDGFLDNAAYDQTAAYGKVNYNINDASRLNFVYSYDDGHNEDPLINYPDFWDDIGQTRSYQRLLFKTFFADNLSMTVEGRHHDYDIKIDDVFADHREVYNDYNDKSWGGSVKVNYLPNQKNIVNLGFDGDWGEFDWNNYAQKYDTRNWAVYANDTFSRDNFSANAGLRYDDNRDFGSAVSPSAGVVVRMLDDRALIRAQVAKGFSAPPAAWVKDPIYGSEHLDPETAVNYQLGSEMRFLEIFRFEVNLFYADVDDLIQYDPDTRKFKNIDKVVRKGVEGSLSAAFDFGLDLSVSGNFTDVKDDVTHEEIKDIPKEQYQVSAGYTWQWMTHCLFGKYTDYNSTYPETKDKKFVFDYKFKAKLPEIQDVCQAELFCAVYNLFNSNTLYRSSWPQPDRWAEAGISLSL